MGFFESTLRHWLLDGLEYVLGVDSTDEDLIPVELSRLLLEVCSTSADAHEYHRWLDVHLPHGKGNEHMAYP